MLIASFRNTGIWPFNPDAIPDSVFEASDNLCPLDHPPPEHLVLLQAAADASKRPQKILFLLLCFVPVETETKKVDRNRDGKPRRLKTPVVNVNCSGNAHIYTTFFVQVVAGRTELQVQMVWWTQTVMTLQRDQLSTSLPLKLMKNLPPRKPASKRRVLPSFSSSDDEPLATMARRLKADNPPKKKKTSGKLS
jgi:hypothetical protein